MQGAINSIFYRFDIICQYNLFILVRPYPYGHKAIESLKSENLNEVTVHLDFQLFKVKLNLALEHEIAILSNSKVLTQYTITCSKSTIETL